MKITIGLIIFLFLFSFLFTEGFAQGVDLPNDFETIVYEFAGKYYVKDSHDIITSDNAPDIVIKTALARGGDIYIAGGSYYLSKSFSGFDLKYGTHLKMASDTKIIVPSGYASYVFRFSNDVGQCKMEGGQIYEASPVKRGWIGIMMQGGTGGVFFNYIDNSIITNPYIVIDFNATTGQWVNANTFVDIKGWNFVRGIEFDFLGKHINGIDGFNGNTFRDSQFQSGPMTTYGVKDIKHQFNAFYNTQFWDLPSNAISSTIDSSAENTIIIGGLMTHKNFVDNGKNTIILDTSHSSNLSNSATLSMILSGTTSPQMNIPILQSNHLLNMSITQQAASDFVNGNHGQLVISPVQPTKVNIYGTVTNPMGGSVLLTITRPDSIVEQNQTDITSSGTFYYPITFDKNSLTGEYRIDGSYHNSNLGSLFLNVTTDQIQTNNTLPEMGTNYTLYSNTINSTQIKNNAKLWSQGKVGNDLFLNNIQYLVKIGIIKNSVGGHIYLHPSSIPTWFKNNAEWWAAGQISDKDFFSGIQYLLNSGIIRMPS